MVWSHWSFGIECWFIIDYLITYIFIQDGPSGSGTSPKACKSKKATENAQTNDGYLDTSDDEDEDDDDEEEEDLWEDMRWVVLFI